MNKMKFFFTVVLSLSGLLTSCEVLSSKEKKMVATSPSKDFKIIAYYTPETGELTEEQLERIDQIIYSFLHLKGERLNIGSKKDSLSLAYLTSLKEKKPDLEVLVSLGGWGGCETCSTVFSDPISRIEFSRSVKDIIQQFNVDGIDLDWEYPAIEGFPGHQFKPEDRENFTALIKTLKDHLGEKAIISFAAGGFERFLINSIEWKKVMSLVDRVNIMSYDLGGDKPGTAHHTPLYSTPSQKSSANNVIQFLDSLGVPRKKMVIGAAFYARIWEGVNKIDDGLNQPGKFKEFVLYKDLEKYKEKHPGFIDLRDSLARAPFSFNSDKALFATYDDSLSVSQKTEYALENELGGIMFWQLSGDKKQKGLLFTISEVKKNFNKKQ